MSHIFHRSLMKTLPTVVKGEGNYLIDDTGKRYLDACGGAAVSCLGHSNAVVTQAITTQLEQVPFAHTSFFTNDCAETLATLLVENAPEGTGNGRVMFVGSGSEAMEAALKLARQYHLEKGETQRSKIIARTPSYHGNTLGALAAGGHAGRKAPFQPLLIDVDHIESPYPYRMQEEGETEAAFALRMANLLEERIEHLDAQNVMAFIAEPVVGASLGTQPPPKGYFKRIREICDKHGILLIADEVMCGMGRTGTLYALEQEGICADITTLAKGLGAGYQPIAAVLAAQKVVAAVEAGSKSLWNGHTYMSHAAATAGALAVQQVIQNDNLLQNIKERADQLCNALTLGLSAHPNVGDIRGRGLFLTIEIVADKQSKQTFATTDSVAFNIQKNALELGLMVYPAQGCADGQLGDHILLAPSYTSSIEEIDTIAELVICAINTTLN